MRILLHGNSAGTAAGARKLPEREGGFILLDALLCLFISALLFLFLETCGVTALRASEKLLDRCWAVVAKYGVAGYGVAKYGVAEDGVTEGAHNDIE
jgi:hypothetical protein